MGIVGGTGNSNMGPVLDAQGRPITWWRVSARSIITGGSFGTAFCPDLSALDLQTGDRIILPTTRDIHQGGPGMELDNHHMLTAAGDYIYYHNPFRQARWLKLDGQQNPTWPDQLGLRGTRRRSVEQRHRLLPHQGGCRSTGSPDV